MLRLTILSISAAGTLLFGVIFALSYLHPLLIERAAREVIRIEVQARAVESIDALSNSRVVRLAEKMLRKTDEEIERTRGEIRSQVPSQVDLVLAMMLNKDCACRARMVEKIEETQNDRLASLSALRASLARRIENIYGDVTGSLTRELRIFTASNAAAFALLGLVTSVRRKDARQLLLPAAVLVGAVLVTGSVYLFSQNWLHAIVYSDYVGLGYIAYLLIVALLLADVAFNRARLTRILVHAMLIAAGGVFAGASC